MKVVVNTVCGHGLYGSAGTVLGGNPNWKKSRWKSETIENTIKITRSKNRSFEKSKPPKRKREFQTSVYSARFNFKPTKKSTRN